MVESSLLLQETGDTISATHMSVLLDHDLIDCAINVVIVYHVSLVKETPGICSVP